EAAPRSPVGREHGVPVADYLASGMVVLVGKNIFDPFYELDVVNVADIEGHQVYVIVRIEDVAVYRQVHVASYRDKAPVDWARRIGIVQDVDSFGGFIVLEIVPVDVDVARIV